MLTSQSFGGTKDMGSRTGLIARLWKMDSLNLIFIISGNTFTWSVLKLIRMPGW